MLVLGRRVGQTILIGDDIEITVGQIERHQVRLRISTPQGRYGLLGRVGQPLVISDSIEVTISRIQPGYVPQADLAHIRIYAPREIRIFREELYHEIKRVGFKNELMGRSATDLRQ